MTLAAAVARCRLRQCCCGGAQPARSQCCRAVAALPRGGEPQDMQPNGGPAAEGLARSLPGLDSRGGRGKGPRRAVSQPAAAARGGLAGRSRRRGHGGVRAVRRCQAAERGSSLAAAAGGGWLLLWAARAPCGTNGALSA